MVNSHSGAEYARYEQEVGAITEECTTMIGALTRIQAACQEAKAKGGIPNLSNYETTVAHAHRALIKKIGVVGYLQSLGLKFRPPHSNK